MGDSGLFIGEQLDADGARNGEAVRLDPNDLTTHGVIVGTTSVWDATRYGAFHQLGTSRIPARPFLPPGRLPLAWGLRLAHAADLALPLP